MGNKALIRGRQAVFVVEVVLAGLHGRLETCAHAQSRALVLLGLAEACAVEGHIGTH